MSSSTDTEPDTEAKTENTVGVKPSKLKRFILEPQAPEGYTTVEVNKGTDEPSSNKTIGCTPVN